HHRVRGHCHDSTPLLLSALGLGTPVAVCRVISSMAKPQRGSSTAVHHAQHVATHTLQGAETVCRPDAQAPLCGLSAGGSASPAPASGATRSDAPNQQPTSPCYRHLDALLPPYRL